MKAMTPEQLAALSALPFEVEGAGGVYAIFNSHTKHAYFGQTEGFKKRFATHRAELRRGRHHNNALQAQWNAHGERAFLFIPIAIEDDVDKRLSLEASFAQSMALVGLSLNQPHTLVTARFVGPRLNPPLDSPRSIRLPTPEWEKLKRLGMQWLIRQIRKAKE